LEADTRAAHSLASVNPFAESSFSGDDSKNGSHTIPEDESVTFPYRVVTHEDKTLPDVIETLFGDFVTGIVPVHEKWR
jgi:hypothetical protein